MGIAGHEEALAMLYADEGNAAEEESYDEFLNDLYDD